MTSSIVDEVTEQRIEHMTGVWFIDDRVQLISDGIVKMAVASILGSLVADPESTSIPIESARPNGFYTIAQTTLLLCSAHTEMNLAERIARALSRILKCDIKEVTVSEVDDKGAVTFTYTV